MPETAGTQVSYTPEDRIHDPRELEAWFQRLPEHARDEFRARWRVEETRLEDHRLRRRGTTTRYLVEGVALYVVPLLVLSDVSLGVLLPCVGIGLAVGFLAARVRAGTFAYPGFALAGYVAIVLATGYLNILAFIFYVSFGALLGLGHSLQRYDGSEA